MGSSWLTEALEGFHVDEGGALPIQTRVQGRWRVWMAVSISRAHLPPLSSPNNNECKQTKAEELAWEQAKQHGIDLVTILPEFILGPVLSPHACGTSVGALQGWLHGASAPGTFTFADVRAVARAHVRAAEVPRAGGRRFIVAARQATTGRQISAILRVRDDACRRVS